jgi:hypothetical protein
MRAFLSLACLAALVAGLLPAADAQMDFQQGYQVRGAVGDIPSTPAVERAGTWNVEQLLKATHTNGTAQEVRFNLPTGSSLETVLCSCPHVSNQVESGTVVVTLAPNNPSGVTDVRVVSSQPFNTAVALSVRAPAEAPKDAEVILYVPVGMAFEAAGKASSPGSSTSGTSTIQAFTFDASAPMPDPFWATIHPSVADTASAAPASYGMDFGAGFLLLGGLLAGALLWAFLVSRGIVQRKGRKQVAATAAHVEAAQNDPPAVLEGKKRGLLAALKEVEIARQTNEMDVPTYDAVKAEFKKQAVTVMRALDENEGKKA